jgi:hypothetical protein
MEVDIIQDNNGNSITTRRDDFRNRINNNDWKYKD